MRRKQPRWVIPFLRALARTGEVTAAAADAGIDKSTAYARARAHADFASLWRGAVALHKEMKKRAEDEEIAKIEAGRLSPSPGSPFAKLRTSPTSLPGRGRGEELVVSAGQVKRVGRGRWSQAKERIFFEELAATANARRAAEAVGLSKNAVLQRRLRHPLFAAKLDAVVRSARATINLYTIEAANQTFDPDSLDTGDVTPKVTIDQAIKISQIDAAKSRKEDQPDPFAGDAATEEDRGIEAVRESLLSKLRRIRAADRKEQLAIGWTLDESFDVMIPPGYIKGPDYRPKPPELPTDYYSPYRMGGGPRAG